MRRLLRCLDLGDLALLAVLVIAAFFALIHLAAAHDAPSGWSYPVACCSNFDCREVPYTSVREGGEGYVIEATGEVLPYGDARVKDSPDGEFHWCSAAGAMDGRTICLFVPPRSY